MVKVAVLGGGINGAACAFRIKHNYRDLNVTLVSDEFSPDTTGDGSGGLWLPYLCADTPKPLLRKWGIETYKFLHSLWLEGGHDISLMPIYSFYTEPTELFLAEWAEDIFGYQKFDEKQLQYYNKIHSNVFVSGEVYTTFTVYPQTIIQELYKKFKQAGGNIEKLKITSLNNIELKNYDVVVNCTGLGSRNIVPDTSTYPIRGQVMKVLAPWQNATVITDEGFYVIPNNHNCVMGGTHQKNDYRTEVDAKDVESIKNGCTQMLPHFKNVKIISHWVGLRPCRNEVRLDTELKNGKLIIHNYGHGGSGLTLFWGCASDVLQLLEPNLKRKAIRSKI